MRNYVAFIMLIASAMLSAQMPVLIESKVASDISVIPKEYTTSGAPTIVAADYDAEANNYYLQRYDANLENGTSSTFTPSCIAAPTRRNFGKSTDYYDCKLHILSDTIMSRLSIVVNPNIGLPKTSGITQGEVEQYFIPSLTKVTLSSYDANTQSAKSEELEYVSFNMWGGTVFACERINPYDVDDLPNARLYYRLSYEWRESIFGPYDFVYFLNKNGELYKVTFKRDLEITRGSYGFTCYSRNLDQTDETHNFYISQPLPVRVMNRGLNGSDCNVIYTQTLFNNDDALEYIGFKYGSPKKNFKEEDRDQDGYIDYREVSTEYSVTGLSVASTEGSTLYSFDFPSGYKLADKDIDLLDMEKSKYLIVRVRDGKNDWYMLIYRIDPERASMEQIGAPVRARVAPTVVNRGTDITVELPEGQGCSDIIVTSASGRTVMTDRVPDGGGQTSIETGTLSPGMHIVTVADNDNNTRESTKVIVK